MLKRTTKQNNLWRSKEKEQFNEESKRMSIPCSALSALKSAMKCTKVQNKTREKKFVPFAASSWVPQSYTLSAISLPLLLSLFCSFHYLVTLSVPLLPQPPAPCFSRLSSALAAFCGSLPEALLWTDSALRAKNCPPMWRGIRGGGAQSQSQEGAEAICVLVGQHAVSPEEPSTTVKCQVILCALQCDGEGTLPVLVLHSVNTEHSWHIFSSWNWNLVSFCPQPHWF